MKIGLLAYHAACNMGATLQLLSTYSYLKNSGHAPIVINWVAEDLEKMYERAVPKEQQELQLQLRRTLWNETALCRTSEDVARVITEDGIQAVIVGSDAVAQNHPVLERLHIDVHKLIKIDRITSDRVFPNPFWGEFNRFLEKPVPVAMLSGSSQDSHFRLIPSVHRKQMKLAIEKFSYISVRDSWTQNMIAYITSHSIVPPVTPDPVFAFNYNAGDLIPSKQTILKKYNLPEKYFIFSFLNNNDVSQEWLSEFEKMSTAKEIACVSLPFAHKPSFGHFEHTINMPLSPLDWFALIKYSQGYIGNNMHPIIVSIHNNVPFFSFDNYGIRRFHNLITSDKSSKILHILRKAGLDEYRISVINRHKIIPSPAEVFNKLILFPIAKEKAFAAEWQNEYLTVMQQILSKLQ